MFIRLVIQLGLDQKVGYSGKAFPTKHTLNFAVKYLTMGAGPVTPSAPTRFGFWIAFAVDEMKKLFNVCYLRCILPDIGKCYLRVKK